MKRERDLCCTCAVPVLSRNSKIYIYIKADPKQQGGAGPDKAGECHRCVPVGLQ